MNRKVLILLFGIFGITSAGTYAASTIKYSPDISYSSSDIGAKSVDKNQGINTFHAKQTLNLFDGHSYKPCPGNPSIPTATLENPPPLTLGGDYDICYDPCDLITLPNQCDAPDNYDHYAGGNVPDNNCVSNPDPACVPTFHWDPHKTYLGYYCDNRHNHYGRTCKLLQDPYNYILDGALFTPSSFGFAKNAECSAKAGGTGPFTTPNNFPVISEATLAYKWDEVPPACTRSAYSATNTSDFLSDTQLDTIRHSNTDGTLKYASGPLAGSVYTGAWTNQDIKATFYCADGDSGCADDSVPFTTPPLRHMQISYAPSGGISDKVGNTALTLPCGATTISGSCLGSIPSTANPTTSNQYTQTWNGTSWTPPDIDWKKDGTFVAGLGTVCGFDCKTDYPNWDSVAATCINTTPTAQYGSCGGALPANAQMTSSPTFLQTKYAGVWSPASMNWTYGSVNCGFVCSTGYIWNGTACVSIASPTRSWNCSGLIPAHAASTTPISYTQVQTFGVWGPTYSWTHGATTCGFTCSSGYIWNGSACIVSASPPPFVPPSSTSEKVYISDVSKNDVTPATLNGTGCVELAGYTIIDGVDKNNPPKGCAKLYGNPGCDSPTAGFRNYTADEWVSTTRIATTKSAYAYPVGIYEFYSMYGTTIKKIGEGHLKSCTATIVTTDAGGAPKDTFTQAEKVYGYVTGLSQNNSYACASMKGVPCTPVKMPPGGNGDWIWNNSRWEMVGYPLSSTPVGVIVLQWREGPTGPIATKEITVISSCTPRVTHTDNVIFKNGATIWQLGATPYDPPYAPHVTSQAGISTYDDFRYSPDYLCNRISILSNPSKLYAGATGNYACVADNKIFETRHNGNWSTSSTRLGEGWCTGGTPIWDEFTLTFTDVRYVQSIECQYETGDCPLTLKECPTTISAGWDVDRTSFTPLVNKEPPAPYGLLPNGHQWCYYQITNGDTYCSSWDRVTGKRYNTGKCCGNNDYNKAMNGGDC